MFFCGLVYSHQVLILFLSIVVSIVGAVPEFIIWDNFSQIFRRIVIFLENFFSFEMILLLFYMLFQLSLPLRSAGMRAFSSCLLTEEEFLFDVGTLFHLNLIKTGLCES